MSKKKVIGGFIITISILISFGVCAHINNRSLLSASRKVSHLNDVLYPHEAEMSRRIGNTDVAFVSLLSTTVLILAAVFGTHQVHLAGCSRAGENVGRLHCELEAFTYSVSHDLRAPLRSIHGYSQILQAEYGEKLDANGGRIIDTVIKNARKMGRLINDLLDFSHVGRSTLHRGKVNMHDVINAFLANNIDRKKHETLRVYVHTLPPAVTDIGLIRQVWTNLISNAIKCCSKKEFPQVWINAFETGPEIVYSVCDNGVGFDMPYVHKLFGVFQRLHWDDEFEGTGPRTVNPNDR